MKRAFVALFMIMANILYSYDLSICAVFQNEAQYMQEWIEFHRLVGVEHFWLYNNNSNDNYMEVLQPYIDQGVVDLIDWPSKQNDWNNYVFKVQPLAYSDAVKKATGTSRWLAILDLDEFLYSPICNHLMDLLDTLYKDCSGLYVNWQLFGTSFIAEIQPHESLIEKLVLKAPINYARNCNCKSIVRPEFVRGFNSPHYALYKEGHYHQNPDLKNVKNVNQEIVIDKLRINHYWTRDEKYFNEIKIPRYKQWNVMPIQSVLYEASKLNAIYDGDIQRFVPALKIAMGKTCDANS